MYPGKRPYRATFTVPSDERDEIGNLTGESTVLGYAWISLAPVTGREYIYASGERALVTHKVTLARPAFEIPISAVIAVSGRRFEVLTPLDAPNDAEITVMCVEKRV